MEFANLADIMTSMQPSLLVPLVALWLQASPAAAQSETPLPELPLENDAAGNEEPPDSLQSPLEPDGAAGGFEGVSPAGSGRSAGLYRECLNIAAEDPRGAIDFAFAWQADGNSLAAKHCSAIAYSALDRFGLAAKRLGEITRDLRTGRDLPPHLAAGKPRATLLAQIYAQLGNARLLEGNADAAYSAFSAGLAALPEAAKPIRVELLVDRARTLGAAGDFEAALKDLVAAQKLAPDRGDIALYRASAHRALDDLEAALKAVSEAIEGSEASPAALLERGNIRMLREETTAARRDWQEVVARWPDSSAAGAAKANLARLDGKVVGSGKDGSRSSK